MAGDLGQLSVSLTVIQPVYMRIGRGKGATKGSRGDMELHWGKVGTFQSGGELVVSLP